MSETGLLQEIARRGYSVQWDLTDNGTDFGTLSMELRDAGGNVFGSKSLPVQLRGASITKQQEPARKYELIRWAEEVTRG